MGRILVLEPKWTGHYPNFAAMAALALLEKNHDVTLCLTSAGEDLTGGIPEQAEQAVRHRLEVRRSLPVIPKGYVPMQRAQGEQELDLLLPEIRAMNPDHVVLPSVDAIAFACGTGRRGKDLQDTPTFGCLHDAYIGHGGRGFRFAARRMLARLAFRRCGLSLGTVDPVAAAAGRTIGIRLLTHHPPIGQPDPGGETPDLGLTRPGRVVLVAGEHSPRKGTDRIIRAWPSPCPANATLLVAGRCGGQVRQALAERQADVDAGGIVVLDQVLDNNTFRACFAAADCTVAVYPKPGPISGIVLQAAGMNLPVLGSREGALGLAIKHGGLGETIASDSDAILEQAMARVAESDPVVDSRQREAFNAWYSMENFANDWRHWVLGKQTSSPAPLPSPYPS